MDKRALFIILAALLIMPIAFIGCKAKPKEVSEIPGMEMQEGAMSMAIEEPQLIEPAQTVATETIPPTAAPELAARPAAIPQENRARDIQRALKNAGFYAGAIDGKIGPRTKRAIEDFQTAKGLKADGKVGPKTWAELEKYLIQQ